MQAEVLADDEWMDSISPIDLSSLIHSTEPTNDPQSRKWITEDEFKKHETTQLHAQLGQHIDDLERRIQEYQRQLDSYSGYHLEEREDPPEHIQGETQLTPKQLNLRRNAYLN